ncbi:MAG: ArsR/SmtB family transcription factor [Planctomycetota bacterium]
MNRLPPTPRSVPDDATCCLPKPALADRRLLSNGSAAELAGLFKVLASDTRLRLLHALVRDGELCVSELCRQVRMKPQAVSNQLQRLADWGIVDSRRDGLQVFYRITDPCVPELLDRGLCLLEDAKERRR